MNEVGYSTTVHHTVIKTESSVIKSGVRPEGNANEDYVSPPKYKSSLLNRYLNDSLRHVMASNAALMEKTRQRNHSGSFSSNEFDEELVSPSSSETEGNFVYRTGKLSRCLFAITLSKLNECCGSQRCFSDLLLFLSFLICQVLKLYSSNQQPNEVALYYFRMRPSDLTKLLQRIQM